jgi:hypothetical protein
MEQGLGRQIVQPFSASTEPPIAVWRSVSPFAGPPCSLSRAHGGLAIFGNHCAPTEQDLLRHLRAYVAEVLSQMPCADSPSGNRAITAQGHVFLTLSV